MKTLVFSATYNEAGNVGKLLEGICAAAPGADILIVDDRSRDGTVDAMKMLGLSNLTIVQRPGKMGLGTAHLFAFCYAVHYGYDRLVTMDADGSHEPSSIPGLLDKIGQGYDFAIGSRYMAGGSCDYDGYRLRVSQAANIAARLLLGIKLSEFTTSFRAFRVTKLRTFSFPRLLVGGYSFFLTTVVEAARRGMRLAELPIHFCERGYGSSKIPSFEIFRGMLNLSRLALIKAFLRRPAVAEQALFACNACGNAYSLILMAANSEVRGTCVHCGVVQ
ncbi:glycosyltransferase [Xanthomonas campestris pv. campestris]|nr:glycosyltransferase [Xanthomonas campestris pv. campestris]MEB1552509.1 glycosyltransferase [Xanthomonas campestris pv. campestris]